MAPSELRIVGAFLAFPGLPKKRPPILGNPLCDEIGWDFETVCRFSIGQIKLRDIPATNNQLKPRHGHV